jgi:hypothetical protein
MANTYYRNTAPFISHVEIVCKERDSLDMVEMCVGYQNTADFPLLSLFHSQTYGACIKEQATV